MGIAAIICLWSLVAMTLAVSPWAIAVAIRWARWPIRVPGYRVRVARGHVTGAEVARVLDTIRAAYGRVCPERAPLPRSAWDGALISWLPAESGGRYVTEPSGRRITGRTTGRRVEVVVRPGDGMPEVGRVLLHELLHVVTPYDPEHALTWVWGPDGVERAARQALGR